MVPVFSSRILLIITGVDPGQVDPKAQKGSKTAAAKDSPSPLNHHDCAAVRDREDAVQKHINDSLSLLPPIDRLAAELSQDSLKVIDVGSGAGFPGVALAIARPQWQVCCLHLTELTQDFISSWAA